MTMRISVGVSMFPQEVDEIDDRSGGESRSQYIREAVKARFEAEDAGEWESPNNDDADAADEATAQN